VSDVKESRFYQLMTLFILGIDLIV
jgi:hypothetical protein